VGDILGNDEIDHWMYFKMVCTFF